MIDGEKLAEVGFEKLGTPYKDMDCQAFVEWCFRKLGFNKDLKGSNAWYRYIMQHGTVMTPEECVRQLGTVPHGAILFIHAYDGKEENVGYHDGFGNASHIGIRTARSEGAIHSSSSRGCVAESKFKNKTINGGWNMVGLPDFVMYDYTTGGDTGFPDAPAWHSTIRRGDKGNDVAYCQSILAGLGYDLGAAGVDGDFGRKTEEAVIQFQRNWNTGHPGEKLIDDGIVGPMTWDALERSEKTEPTQEDPDERWTVIIPDVPTNEKDALLKAYPWGTAEKGRG